MTQQTVFGFPTPVSVVSGTTASYLVQGTTLNESVIAGIPIPRSYGVVHGMEPPSFEYEIGPEFFGMTFFDNTNNAASNNTPLIFDGVVGTIGKRPGERWMYIQPTSGASYDWAPIDEQVEIAERYGQTEMIYVVELAPGWTTTDRTQTAGNPNITLGAGLVTNNTTASGNDTLHFASVHANVQVGHYVKNASAVSTIPDGTTVIAKTATTIQMSANAAGAGVGNGDTIYVGPWETWLAPDDINDYTDFIDALLTRYPQITTIFPYTEPQNFPIPIADAVEMSAAMVTYVHANFPGVKVGSPTIQPRGDGNTVGFWYYDFFDAYYDGGNPNFDILMWHGYTKLTGSDDWKTAGSANLETVDTRVSVSMVGAIIDNFPQLQSLPIWDEESSWGTDANATAHSINKSAFVAQYLYMHASWRNVRTVWYGPTGLGWGTIWVQNGSGGGSLNDGGTAYLEVHRQMLGSTLIAPIELNDDGFRVGFWRRQDTPGYRACCVWRPDGVSTAFTIPAGLNYARYVDGTDDPVTPGDTIDVTDDPIWLESSFRS